MACLCIPLYPIRVFWDVPQIGVDGGDSHDVGMEPEGNGVLYIYDDAYVIDICKQVKFCLD